MFKDGDLVKFNKECKLSFGSFKVDYDKSYVIESIGLVEPYFLTLIDVDSYIWDQSRFVYDLVEYRKLKINKIKERTC